MSEPVAIKPKRTLSESQLEKLKLARVKALAVKKKLKEEGDVERIKHLEGKIAKLKVKDKTPDEAPLGQCPPRDAAPNEVPVVWMALPGGGVDCLEPTVTP